MVPLGPGLEQNQSLPHPISPSCSESLAGDTKAWLSFWGGGGEHSSHFIPLLLSVTFTAICALVATVSQRGHHGSGEVIRESWWGQTTTPACPSGLTLGAGMGGPREASLAPPEKDEALRFLPQGWVDRALGSSFPLLLHLP